MPFRGSRTTVSGGLAKQMRSLCKIVDKMCKRLRKKRRRSSIARPGAAFRCPPAAATGIGWIARVRARADKSESYKDVALIAHCLLGITRRPRPRHSGFACHAPRALPPAARAVPGPDLPLDWPPDFQGQAVPRRAGDCGVENFRATRVWERASRGSRVRRPYSFDRLRRAGR